MSEQTNLYRHWDEEGNLLYVGISISAIGRLAQHSKASHWAGRIANVTIETFASRREAEDAERIAIIDERPRHNIVHAANDNAHDERVARAERMSPLGRRVDARMPVSEIKEMVAWIVEDDMQGQLHNGRTWADIDSGFARRAEWNKPGKIRAGRDQKLYPMPTQEEVALSVALLVGDGDMRMWGDRIFPSRIGLYPFAPPDEEMPRGEFFPPQVMHLTGTEIANRLQTANPIAVPSPQLH